MRKRGNLLWVALLAACYAGRGEAGDRELPAVEQAYAPNWKDIRDVIWLEWGGSTWGDIAYAKMLHEDKKIPENDLFVLLFMVRSLGQPMVSLVELYEEKERDLHQVVLGTGFDRDRFFVPISPEVLVFLSLDRRWRVGSGAESRGGLQDGDWSVSSGGAGEEF